MVSFPRHSGSSDASDAEARSPSPIHRVRSFLAKRAESLKERRISFSSNARARRMSTSKAATTVQANWRGQMARRSTKKNLLGRRTALPVGNGSPSAKRNPSPFAKRNPAPRPEEAHRAKMAAFFWGSATPEEQLRQLNRLSEELAKTASKPAVAAAAAQSAKAPAECSSAHDPLGQSAPTMAPSAAEISSAITLQAGIRGKQARAHKRRVPAKSPPRTPGISLATILRCVAAFLKAGVAALLVWQLAFTTPRFFDGLVQVAGFAALLCATLYGVLQGALPDQTGEETRSAALIQARIRALKERRLSTSRLRPKGGKTTTSSSKATTSSSKATTSSSEARSVTLIQARIRGKNERRLSRLRPKSGKATISLSEDLASAVLPQAAASSPRALHGKAAIGAAVGAAAAAWLVATVTPRIFSWVAYPVIVTALVCGSIYSWLRLPFWLGYLASELITRLALHGYPLRMRSLRLRPWVELRPLKLHLDLFATGAPRRVKPSLPSPLARGQRTNAIYVQPPTFSVCARLAAQTFTLPTRPAALRRTSCLRTRCTPSLRSS